MIDYKQTYNGLLAHIENKVSGKYCDRLHEDDLHSMTKFVASVPFEGTKKYLSQETVTADDGSEMSGEQLRFFIKIVCGLPVSSYLYCTQVSKSFFNSAVPYFLYCHKLHHGTDYMVWKDHPFIKLFLGRHLAPILKMDNHQFRDILDYTPAKLMQFRTKALVWGGKPQPVTTWNIARIKDSSVFDSIHKSARLMILQAWVHNVVTRTKWMINDPINWDNMPESLDEAVLMQDGNQRAPRIEDMI